MARYSMSSGKVSSGALAAAGVKSLVLLNPVSHRGVITELWVSCAAISDQVGTAVELYRTVTLGSPAGTTGTVVKDSIEDASASLWTGLVNLTTEPTSVEVLRASYISTIKGVLVVLFPLGREPVGAADGARLGLRLINDGAGAMTAVDFRATLAWET